MFAKLKKKIEEGGGAMSPGPTDPGSAADRSSSGPGLASPIKTYGASPLKPRDAMGGDFETVSASSEISEVKATTSKEDLFKKIMKKNEQIRKLEGKITDLASMIKDRNKNIERLEKALEKQRTEYEERIQNLDARLQRQRSKASPSPSPTASGGDPFSATVVKLEKENARLQAQIKEMEQQRGSRSEPLASELASVKEMLSLSQKDLESSQSYAKDKDGKLQAALKKGEELEKEIQSLMSQILHLTTTNEKLEESKNVATMKQSELQAQDDENQRKAERYQQKLEAEVSAKEESLSTLRERVRTLEQRLQNSAMSGDEQLAALQTERNTLEEKLTEVREQLTHARAAGSERSAQLLQQVTQLNTCLTEERQTSKQLESKMAVAKHEQQAKADALQLEIESLKKALTKKEKEIDKSTVEVEARFEKERRVWLDKEAALSASISQLNLQLEEANKQRELDEASYQQKLSIAVEAESVRQSKSSEKLTQDFASLQKQLKSSENEKDELLVRNATLSQEFESYKRKALAHAEDGRAEIQHKNHAIAGLEQVLQDMQTELDTARTKISELEQAQTVAINDVESAEVNRLQEQLSSQEEMLNERNKTIKKQQQRLADLKKTLQRELNVQALPNDEITETPKDTSKSAASNRDPPSFVNSYTVTNGYSTYDSKPGALNDTVNSAPSLQVSSSSTVNMSHMHRPHLHNNPGASALNYDSDFSDMTLAMSSRPRETSRGRTGALEYQRDVNFDYLRHVVLKFMLSRESEAVHLIKAVAMLLDFTSDEQKMLKQTLEWKMSWFGSRPKLGEGQFSKYVPSTY